MHALSTTYPMSKITPLAISQKPLNPPKKDSSLLFIFRPFCKFKIPITTEIRQIFQYLGNQHLMAQDATYSKIRNRLSKAP